METLFTMTNFLLLFCLSLSFYIAWNTRRFRVMKRKEVNTQQNLDSAILELQHRVRNNLQVVSSLVELQGVEASLRGTESASRNIAYRVRAVSSAQDISCQQRSDRVNAISLVNRIIAILYPQVSVPETPLEPIFLTQKQATALALVTNEVLLDAKRRFLHDICATLDMSENRITMTLDLSSGIRGGVFSSLDDLSKQIVETLVKHDLQGLSRIDVGSGIFEVSFPQVFTKSSPLAPQGQSEIGEVNANKPPTVRRREALGYARLQGSTRSFGN